MSQSQQLCFFSIIAYVNAAGVLNPDDRNFIAREHNAINSLILIKPDLIAAFRPSFIGFGVFRILREISLAVPDHHQVSIDPDQACMRLPDRIQAKFHVLGTIDQPCCSKS